MRLHVTERGSTRPNATSIEFSIHLYDLLEQTLNCFRILSAQQICLGT